jgi:hypothetical protein
VSEIHGSEARVYAGGLDISSLFREMEAGRSRELVDTTAFGDTADTHIDSPIVAGDMTAAGMLDVDPSTGAHTILEMLEAANALTSGDHIVVAMMRDTTIGDPGFGMSGSQQQLRVKNPMKDVAQTSFAAKANQSAWVRSLHPLGAETDEFDAVGYDAGADSDYGGIGFLTVTAISGSSPVLSAKIQHSSDSTDGEDGTWVDLLAFDAINTAGVAARYADAQSTTDTVNQWTRLSVAITSGTLTSVTLAAQFGRYTSNR